MVKQAKPEVHLELCSGFFRIPTESVNYNIRVLDIGESTVNTVVSQIVETETMENNVPQVADDFYRRVAGQFSNEFSRLTESMSLSEGQATPLIAINEIASLAIDNLNGLAATAVEVDQGLLALHESFAALADKGSDMAGKEDESSPPVDVIQGIKEGVVRAKEILAKVLAESASSGGAASVAAPPAATSEPVTKTRYLFDLDVVFQTMYELCTNETVKTHSQDARAKADTLFDKDVFLDLLSEKVGGYEEDDGFLSVPINDVLTSLIKGCEDKTVINLLRNMNKKQADIFLDQFLPLEVPVTEEVVVAGESAPLGEESDTDSEGGDNGPGLARLTEVNELLVKIVSDLEQLSTGDASPDKNKRSVEENKDDSVVPKIDELLTQVRAIAPALQGTVTSLEGILSQSVEQAQDRLLSGLLNIGQSIVTCVTQKEENSALLFSEVDFGGFVSGAGVVFGKNDHGESGGQSVEIKEERVKAEIVEEDDLPVLSAESDSFDEEIVDDDDDFGEASQDDIDKLLEDMS